MDGLCYHKVCHPGAAQIFFFTMPLTGWLASQTGRPIVFCNLWSQDTTGPVGPNACFRSGPSGQLPLPLPTDSRTATVVKSVSRSACLSVCLSVWGRGKRSPRSTLYLGRNRKASTVDLAAGSR